MSIGSRTCFARAVRNQDAVSSVQSTARITGLTLCSLDSYHELFD